MIRSSTGAGTSKPGPALKASSEMRDRTRIKPEFKSVKSNRFCASPGSNTAMEVKVPDLPWYIPIYGAKNSGVGRASPDDCATEVDIVEAKARKIPLIVFIS